MAGLYSLDVAEAKQALTKISGGMQADMAAYTKDSRICHCRPHHKADGDDHSFGK